jgi:hypothetical protein
MNMVWHHDHGMKVQFVAILLQTAFQDNIPSSRWKSPPVICIKGDKEWMIILLVMR